jgi:UDP-glucose 4-epimerase
MNKILVTGGLGFIGSHTTVSLMQSGFIPVIVDNCSNSSHDFLNRIVKITGETPAYYDVNVNDKPAMQKIFSEHNIEGVIHFAAFKSVGDSVHDPMLYFRNNIDGLLTLLEVMLENKCMNIVFSSSCSIYGNSPEQPVKETTPLQKAQSPYAFTKQAGEEILEAVQLANTMNVISLRYFNPIGAHESAIIGEAPIGVPTNLVPYLTQTAAGIRDVLTVHGADYPTADGTCIRDYIHVMDLADAHVKALGRILEEKMENGYEVFNLGTGKGSSVLDCIRTFEDVNKMKVNYRIGPRREGDVVAVWADTDKANNMLGWKAKRDLKDMMRDAWKWQQQLATGS